MNCRAIRFMGHAVRRMYERGLQRNDIVEVMRQGEVIADYPDDRPYPSRLMLGFVAGKPVHVVVARDAGTEQCFVVTAYRPDPSVWTDDFRTRRSS